MKQLLAYVCLVLLIAIVGLADTAAAEESEYDRAQTIRNHVFDKLPIDVASLKGGYFARVVLRFSNPDVELVLVVYGGWKSELVSYTLDGEGGQTLSKYIWSAIHNHPQLLDDDIAGTVHVTTKRAFVDSQKVKRTIEELRKIKISPFFEGGIGVDEYSDYDYFFDASGEECVHYRLHAISHEGPTGDLVRWMTRFRQDFK